MLPKNVHWTILAQCDFFAVESLVQTSDRPAMKTIEPLRKSIFQRKLANNTNWKETFDVVCSAYGNLSPNFKICHDNFGGYRLMYKGTQALSPSTVLKRVPVGFIAAVPEGVVTDLSVMASERTGEQFILLGSIRFVNSDCSPNCEYDFSSEYGIVQLRVRRRINPGEELFVKYGPEFFEHNACRCRTCEIRKTTEAGNEIAYELLVHEINVLFVNETLSEILPEIPKMTAAKRKQPESLDLSPPVNAPKRKRIRGRALVELFNEVAGSPLSNEVSPILPNRSSYCLNRQSLLERVETLVDSDSESSSSSQSTSSTENSSLSDEDYSDEGENQQPQLLPNESDSDVSEAKALSVLPFDPEPEHCSSGYLLEAGAPLLNESLFEGSQVSVADATYLTELFCSRFNLSDECSSSLHQLIKTFLPKENNFPSAYSYIKKMKKNFEEEVCFLKKTNSQSICVLNFRFQLRDIIERNLPSILDYSLHRESNPYSDFNKDICPPFRREENATFNLILFSDGVNIKKSTLKRELWPIWIQIADLPPVLRMSRKNIVLAALFAGSKYPSWKMMVPLIKGQLISGVEISQKTGHPFRAYFKVRILESDLCAKSHMLNVFKFNGYYGCNFCTAEGATIGRTHAYYPFEQSGQLREPVVNDVYVKCAEILGVDRLVNVVGIKGKSAFADLVEGLPLTAPVDYMHCVLLGVFPELLNSASNRSQVKIKSLFLRLFQISPAHGK